MLLLRDRFTPGFSDAILPGRPIISIVIFSFALLKSGDGRCAIDLRILGLLRVALGLALVSIVLTDIS